MHWERYYIDTLFIIPEKSKLFVMNQKYVWTILEDKITNNNTLFQKRFDKADTFHKRCAITVNQVCRICFIM